VSFSDSPQAKAKFHFFNYKYLLKMLNRLKNLYQTTVGKVESRDDTNNNDIDSTSPQKIFMCNCCIETITDVRWTCSECEGYDYCDICYQNVRLYDHTFDHGIKFLTIRAGFF
jgi:hypothetical protein